MEEEEEQKQVLPGLEPGQGSEPWVVINYNIVPSSSKRQWCIGNIEASQDLAPGSTPGWRKIFVLGVQQKLKNERTGGIEPPTLGLQIEYYAAKLSMSSFRGSIVVSIPACHAGDSGSIPGFGGLFLLIASQEEKPKKD